MLIKSLIKRAGGTTVQIESDVYHFDGEPDHVCEVENEDHIDAFLAVPEGYVDASPSTDDEKDTKPTANNKGGKKKDKDAPAASTQTQAPQTPEQPQTPAAPEGTDAGNGADDEKRLELLATAESLGVEAQEGWTVEQLEEAINAKLGE